MLRKMEKKEVWFHKVQPLIDHVRDVSIGLIWVLGTWMSIDEMMIRFMGRSNQTHRVKNKPISQGFNSFVLCTYHGFVINFTPDGRAAAYTHQQEYQEGPEGKIASMIKHITDTIEKLKAEDNERQKIYTQKLRSSKNDGDNAITNGKYCIAMDNYFTLPKIMPLLREKGIGVFGTSRFKKNWPPNNLREIEIGQANFNDFYHLTDQHGTLLARWMDNGLVYCVSTIHKPGQMVKKLRKKYRVERIKKKNE